MKKYLAEMLGVMFFVLIIGLSSDPLTIGLALAVLVYVTGPISGGHLNPAVTLSLAIAKKISWSEAIKYRARQLAGAIVAALIFWALRGSTMLILPDDGASVLKILAAEFIFTFLLCVVVHRVCLTGNMKENTYWGFAIGLTVFIGAMCVGRLTGGAFNPAVVTGPALIDLFDGGTMLPYLRIYLVATFAGGAAAGVLFNWSRD